MASWTANHASIKFDSTEDLTPPTNAADSVQEQFWEAARLAAALRASKVVGEGTTYTVNLSGTANSGHPNGDSVTITVTNSN
jgi:hypothetical protein